MMDKKELFVMYFCVVLTMSVMYATQPLQPHFEEILQISKFQASLFMTATLIPLAFASIFYGFLLEKITIKKALIVAFGAFSVLEFIFAGASSYTLLLSIRVLQGFIVPVALTGIVSFISQNSSSKKIASAVSAYVGITILGGFFGRLLSGICSDLFGWRVFFYFISLMLALAVFLLCRIKGDAVSGYSKPKFRTILQIFEIRHNFYTYLAIFCIFFVFQGVLNIMPFELLRLDGNFSGSKIGFMYFGYIIGILVSFNAAKIVKFFGNEIKAIMVGAIIFTVSIQILRIENYGVIFTGMLIFCLGSFIAHSVANGFINKRALSHKAICNGLYISFYYAGGALGTFVPGFFYGIGGWRLFLSVLTVVLFCAIFCIYKLKKYEKREILS